MKYIKKFENFSFEEEEKFGRFAQERESDLVEFGEEGNEFDVDDFGQNCEFCNCTPCDCEDAEETNVLGEDEDDYGMSDDEYDEQEDQEENRIRRWGDEEIVEKKKMNPGFKAYLDKQKAKSKGKEDDKKGGKGKPDFLNKKDDEDKKEVKGLTKGQLKLPKAMQYAILKKQKK